MASPAQRLAWPGLAWPDLAFAYIPYVFVATAALQLCSIEITNAPVDRPSGHQQAFKMAAVSTDARQYSTKDDSAALLPGRLGDVHNMHFGTYPGKV